MMKERLIKKYANRRLYDASISKHVTLEDIRDLIVKGEKIRGKAFLIYWSWNGDRHWLRWRRLGHWLP